jgi:p-cumate 2,3-dioxygenase beta subunit
MSGLAKITRAEVEDFLILEASLLDDWELPRWRELFVPDCRYLVPNAAGDPYASPDNTLFLIADDGHHLTERVKRLGKKTAHAEYPHSRRRCPQGAEQFRDVPLEPGRDRHILRPS